MIIGEKLSQHINVDEVVYHQPTRRYYASELDVTLNKPLDFGRLVYIKAWERFHLMPKVVEIEVFHNHLRRRVTAFVKFTIQGSDVAKMGRQVHFHENEMSAPDDIEHLINDRLEDLEDMVREGTA